MADVRVAPNVVLSDGTTLSQLAAVDSSGRLSVSLTASSATVTVDTELATAAALADGAANPTTATVGAATLTFNGTTWDRARSAAAAQDTTGTGIQAVGMQAQFDDTSTTTVTENQFANLRMSSRRALLIEGVASGTNVNVNLAASAATVTVDSELPAAAALADATSNPTVPGVGAFNMLYNGTTWDRVRGDTTNGMDVDVTRVTGTVTVDTEMPAAAALADATANPTVPAVGSFLMGYNGTTWDRVRTANTGRLQVDIVSGGSADTPTTPIAAYNTASGVSAGSTSNHDSASQTSATTKFTKAIISASVPIKAELQHVDNSVATTICVGFAQAGQTIVLEPPLSRNGRNYWSNTFAGAGTNVWRVIRTNMDPSEAADLYSAIFYES